MGKKYLKVLSGREDLPGIENVAVDLVQQMSNLLQSKQQEMMRNGTPASEANSIAAIAAMSLNEIYVMAVSDVVSDKDVLEEHFKCSDRVLKRLVDEMTQARERAEEVANSPPKPSVTVRRATRAEMEQRPTAALPLDHMTTPPSSFPIQGLKKK
jgi:hypothetical protein